MNSFTQFLLKFSILLFTLWASPAFGQVQTYYVKPIQMDAGYSASEDSSAISINTNTPNNQLFLFIGGTGSNSANNYKTLRLRAANLGFHVINLSYPNSVAAASLANNSDSLAFNKYRQEICFGTPRSNAVSVDTFNSIYMRTLKLLQYLSLTYPTQNWGQYINSPTTLNWSKIAVGGHSQGAGHACYLAKKFQVNRVLMFSGPNDYSDLFSISANWLRKPGLTPVNQHYSYLSLNDEAVDYAKQFANITGLGMLVNDDSTHVDQWQSPFNNSHCLYTTQKPGIVLLNHNVPVKFSSKNNDVWDYMLTSSNSIGISRLDLVYNISVYPNPSHFIVYLRSKNNLQNKFYTLHDLQGKIHSSGTIEDKHEFAVDLTDINVGIYILKIEHVTLKIVKE